MKPMDCSIPSFIYTIRAARAVDERYNHRRKVEDSLWEKYYFDNDGAAHWITAGEEPPSQPGVYERSWGLLQRESRTR